MMKEVQILFDVTDEREFSLRLKSKFSQTAFINGIRWSTSNPPTVDSIDQCTQLLCYIWPRDIYPDFSAWLQARSDGSYVCPQTVFVIQVMRSRTARQDAEATTAPQLLSGSWMFSSGHDWPRYDEMKRFVNGVFRTALEFAAARGYADFGGTPPKWPPRQTTTAMYLIGPSAYRRSQSERSLELRDGATRTPIGIVRDD
jgi:hypothetical protein